MANGNKGLGLLPNGQIHASEASLVKGNGALKIKGVSHEIRNDIDCPAASGEHPRIR